MDENTAGQDSQELAPEFPKNVPVANEKGSDGVGERVDNAGACGDEVWIENEGQLYRLRRTKQGKLILTK